MDSLRVTSKRSVTASTRGQEAAFRWLERITGHGSSIRRAERSRNRNCLPRDRLVVRLGGVASH